MPETVDVTRQIRFLLERSLHSMGERKTGTSKSRIIAIIVE